MTRNARIANRATVALLAAGLAIAPTGAAEAVVDRPSSTPLVGLDAFGALARFPAFASLPDSLTVLAPTLLHGTFTDSAGKPLTGAQVLLSAWPSNETVRALPVGGAFDITPIARSVVGADGTYELRAERIPLLSALIGKNGLDLELDVFHGGRHYVYLTQVVPTVLGGWARAVTGDLLPSPVTTAASPDNLLNIALDAKTGEPLQLDALRPVASRVRADDRPFPGHWCTRYAKETVRRTWTTVATAISRNGAAMDVDYTREAKTETSTGFSWDAGVTFAVAGSRTRTSEFGVEFPELKSPRSSLTAQEFQTRWRHNVLRRECMTDFHGGTKIQYVTSADRASAGSNVRASRYPDFRCRPGDESDLKTEPVYPGTSMNTTTGRAATYGGAFGFSPVGKGLLVGAAQSGYSESVMVKVLGGKRGADWCGDNSDPASASRVQAVGR